MDFEIKPIEEGMWMATTIFRGKKIYEIGSSAEEAENMLQERIESYSEPVATAYSIEE